MIQCGICSRKMYDAPVRDGVYYRCLARTMAPGSLALAEHPRTLNLREDKVVEPLNTWIASLFAPGNRATRPNCSSAHKRLRGIDEAP